MGPFLALTGWALAVGSLFLGGRLVDGLKKGVAEREARIHQLHEHRELLLRLAGMKEVLRLRPTAPESPVRGRVYRSKDEAETILVIEGFPPASADRPYRYWLSQAGKLKEGKVFQVDGLGVGVAQFSAESASGASGGIWVAPSDADASELPDRSILIGNFSTPRKKPLR